MLQVHCSFVPEPIVPEHSCSKARLGIAGGEQLEPPIDQLILGGVKFLLETFVPWTAVDDNASLIEYCTKGVRSVEAVDGHVGVDGFGDVRPNCIEYLLWSDGTKNKLVKYT